MNYWLNKIHEYFKFIRILIIYFLKIYDYFEAVYFSFIYKTHSNFINLQEDKTFHKHKFKIQNDKSRVFSFTDRESQVC